MGGAVSTGEDNDELIDNLVEAEYIKTPLIEKVFRAVDRADYYVENFKKNAYKDLAWKHGNLHLSAPCIYSEVMESLKLEPGLSFLNLGSGTGYLSTMVGLVIGPYGINHGVELHEDVVDYAWVKLKEFKQLSAALDEYEFCEPQFVVGNCLLLDSNARQYDRVYCGASCPKEHENYMKNLIKVGGILLMPLGDQLLQITRSTQTTWDVKTILPVSFASLVLPVSNTEESVKLPDCEPLRLMEVCRLSIRSVLKRNIEREHPKLKDSKRRNPRRKKNRKRIRRIVIPIFEESEDSGQGAEPVDEADDVADEPRERANIHIMNHISGMLHRVVNRRRLHRRRLNRAPNEESNDLSSSSDDSDEDSDEIDNEMDSSAETANHNTDDKEKSPNESLGEGSSGISSQTTSTISSQTEQNLSNGSSAVKENDDDKNPAPPPKSRKTVLKLLNANDNISNLKNENSDEEMDTTAVEPRPETSDSKKRSVEDDDNSEDEAGKKDNRDSPGSDKSKNSSAFSRSLRKRQPPIIWKRVAYEESPPSCDKEGEEEEDVDMEEETYLKLVKEKINCLPLPYALKMYLNHERKL